MPSSGPLTTSSLPRSQPNDWLVAYRHVPTRHRRMIAFRDSFAKGLGLRFEEGAVRLAIRPDLINDGGMFLGPVSFALVDYAMTAELLRAKAAEERIATTHIAINFLASASDGEVT